MRTSVHKISRLCLILLVLGLASGCKSGGGGGSASSETITGVATPNSVSVVTANNAE